jgi:hypothetical protein
MTSSDPARIRPNPVNDPFTWIFAGFSLAAKAQEVAFSGKLILIFACSRQFGQNPAKSGQGHFWRVIRALASTQVSPRRAMGKNLPCKP